MKKSIIIFTLISAIILCIYSLSSCNKQSYSYITPENERKETTSSYLYPLKLSDKKTLILDDAGNVLFEFNNVFNSNIVYDESNNPRYIVCRVTKPLKKRTRCILYDLNGKKLLEFDDFIKIIGDRLIISNDKPAKRRDLHEIEYVVYNLNNLKVEDSYRDINIIDYNSLSISGRDGIVKYSYFIVFINNESKIIEYTEEGKKETVIDMLAFEGWSYGINPVIIDNQKFYIVHTSMDYSSCEEIYDSNGKAVLDKSYKNIYIVDEKIIASSLNESYIFDLSGKQLHKYNYAISSITSDGRHTALKCLDIDANEPQYESLGLFDINGEMILDGYISILEPEENKYIYLKDIRNNFSQKIDIYRDDGKTLKNPIHYYILLGYDAILIRELADVNTNKLKLYFFDDEINESIHAQGDKSYQLGEYDNGYYILNKDLTKYAHETHNYSVDVYNKSGKMLLEDFSDIYCVQNGKAIAQKNDIIGMIDLETGEWLFSITE